MFHFLRAPCYGEVRFESGSGPYVYVEPVGIHVAESLTLVVQVGEICQVPSGIGPCFLGYRPPVLGLEVLDLGRFVDVVYSVLYGNVELVFSGRGVACGHENDAVGPVRSVKGRSRRVLEDCDVFYVVRVDV